MLERFVAVMQRHFRKKFHSLFFGENAVFGFESCFHFFVTVITSAVVIISAGGEEVVCEHKIFFALFLTDYNHFVVNVFDDCAVALRIGKLIVIINAEQILHIIRCKKFNTFLHGGTFIKSRADCNGCDNRLFACVLLCCLGFDFKNSD